MLEALYRTARALPLGRSKAADPAGSGVVIRPAGAEARFVLRVRNAGASAAGGPIASAAGGSIASAAGGSIASAAGGSIASAAGLALDWPINSVTGDDRRWIARLGPDEWLIGCDEAEADHLPASLAADLGERAHAVVDVSHRNVGIDVSGPLAAVALNAGCPLDLGEAAFPAGSATRTLFGKAEIVLIRHHGATPRYRVECWRSFAAYVHDLLAEAAIGAAPAARR